MISRNLTVTLHAKNLLSQVPKSGIVVCQEIEKIPPNYTIVKKNCKKNFGSRSAVQDFELQSVKLSPDKIILIHHPTITEKQNFISKTTFRWTPGVKRLGITNLPPSLTAAEILDQLQTAIRHSIISLQISNIFKVESKPIRLEQSGFASIIFINDFDAKAFWEYASTGNIKLYGHTISAIPDPTGYGIINQAVASLYKTNYLHPKYRCLCSIESNRLKTLEANSLLIPDISLKDYEEFIKPLFEKDAKAHLKYFEEFEFATISFEENTNCLPYCLTSRFKISLNNQFQVTAGFMHCNGRMVTCVFNCIPPPINNDYTKTVIKTPVPAVKPVETVAAEVASEPPTLPTRHVASKRRAKNKGSISNVLSAFDSLESLPVEASSVKPTLDEKEASVQAPQPVVTAKRGRGRPRKSKVT